MEQYTRYTFVTNPGSLPFGDIIAWLNLWVWIWVIVLALILLPLLFPNGRLPSTRWRPVVGITFVALLLLSVAAAFSPTSGEAGLPEVPNPFGITTAQPVFHVIKLASMGALLFCLGAAVAAPIICFRRGQPIERQQIKLFAYATVLLTLAMVVPTAIDPFTFDTSSNNRFLIAVLSTIALPCVPIAIGITILRHRLYDIDVLINRTLVYGTLTACVVALYILVVEYLGTLFRVQDNLPISLLATGLVAVLFQPLREQLQRGVNRMLYGQRDEPYAALARLGRQLEAAIAPDAVLPTIVLTVRDTLRLPYAAILLDQDGARVIAASAGVPAQSTLKLPLVYQGEMIGQFVLGPREQDEPFSPADRRLLQDLARQAGVAAHGVCLMRNLQQLTEDLQRSRQRLVATREEERRRIRGELHDGLGPTLAALPIQIDTVRALMRQNADVADALLVDLKQETQAAVRDIRQLVYALRPPTLDQLGLVPALHELAAKVPPVDLQVTVEAPASLPPLAAAVEVGIYRVVLEALTNVVKHASARRCLIRLTIDREAVVIISDDGVGLPSEVWNGVSLHSLREHAEELGGTCAITPGAEAGTVVCVQIPIDVPDQVGGNAR